MDNLKISIPGKPEYLTMVRLATGSLASLAGFDIGDADDIKMAVCEACKNVSCHGSEGYSDKYDIDFSIEDGVFEVTIFDSCDKHTIEKNEKCRHCPQDGDISMILIRSLMTCVEFGRNDEGKRFINMVKKR